MAGLIAFTRAQFDALDNLLGGILQRLGAIDTDMRGYASEWMDEHPEATTTVQDKAISTAKLADGAVTADKASLTVSHAVTNGNLTLTIT